MIGSSKSYAMMLLKKQFEKISKDPESQFSIGLINGNFFEWEICFQGPQETLYEGGLFTATMSFPDDFPNMPPVLQFKTDFFHPNIYTDGTVCISILHPPGKDEFNEMEEESERWRPVLGIEEILVSVISLINEPNINSPANVDAAVMFRDNYPLYKKKVKELVRKSMDM